MVTILIVILIGYLLGSIPSGVWLGMLIKGIDVRKHGSKSIGATNVFRVLGAKLAVVVLIIDIAKGFAAALLGSSIDLGDTMLSSNQLAMAAGISSICGHLFPLFARFRGGKGVATAAGILLFLAPLEMIFALLVFGATLALTRYVSLSSILATLFFSISIVCEKYIYSFPLGNEMIGLAVLLAALIVFTHRANIARLFGGKESKLGVKTESPSQT